MASFTAPAVAQNTDLVFELTVTDDIAQSVTDGVTVTVQPQGGGGDTAPPVTTGTFTRSVSKGKVSFAITLGADEPATTWFRLNGQGTVTGGGSDTTAWQVYSDPVTVSLAKNGTPPLTITRWIRPGTRKRYVRRWTPPAITGSPPASF